MGTEFQKMHFLASLWKSPAAESRGGSRDLIPVLDAVKEKPKSWVLLQIWDCQSSTRAF